MTTEDTDVFFGSWIIAADFRQDGMVAVDRDMLKIFVKIAESWSAQSLNTFPITPCGPAAFFGLTALSTLLTLCSCIVNWGTCPLGVGVGDVIVFNAFTSKRAKKQLSLSANETLAFVILGLILSKFVRC